MKHVLKRVRVTYEFLAPIEEDAEDWGLERIFANCQDGTCSGHFIDTRVELLTKEQGIRICEEQGTDPALFVDLIDGSVP